MRMEIDCHCPCILLCSESMYLFNVRVFSSILNNHFIFIRLPSLLLLCRPGQTSQSMCGMCMLIVDVFSSICYRRKKWNNPAFWLVSAESNIHIYIGMYYVFEWLECMFIFNGYEYEVWHMWSALEHGCMVSQLMRTSECVRLRPRESCVCSSSHSNNCRP